MSEKLSPIPPNGMRKKSWVELDRILQSNFKTDTYKDNRSATIDIDEFEMNADEIVEAAEKQGYKVKVRDSGHIMFTD